MSETNTISYYRKANEETLVVVLIEEIKAVATSKTS